MEIRVAARCWDIGKQFIELVKGEMLFKKIALYVACLVYAKGFSCTPQYSPFLFYVFLKQTSKSHVKQHKRQDGKLLFYTASERQTEAHTCTLYARTTHHTHTLPTSQYVAN